MQFGAHNALTSAGSIQRVERRQTLSSMIVHWIHRLIHLIALLTRLIYRTHREILPPLEDQNSQGRSKGWFDALKEKDNGN